MVQALKELISRVVVVLFFELIPLFWLSSINKIQHITRDEAERFIILERFSAAVTLERNVACRSTKAIRGKWLADGIHLFIRESSPAVQERILNGVFKIFFGYVHCCLQSC